MSETTQPEGIQRVNRRKVREGTVVSTKMEKTVIVAVVDRVRETRPTSKLKRGRVIEVLERAR